MLQSADSRSLDTRVTIPGVATLVVWGRPLVLWRWAQALSVLRGCMRKPTATVPPCCVSESNAERRQGGTSCLRMYRHTRCPPCLLSCAISILSDPSGDAQTSSLPTHTLYHSSHTRRRANTAKSFLAIFYPRVRPVRVCVCVREVGRLSSDGRRARSPTYSEYCVQRTANLRGPLGLKGWALGRLRLKRLKTGPGPF